MYDLYITMDSSGFLEVKSLVHSYQYVLDINIVTTVYAVVCTVHVRIYVCTRCYLLWTPGYIYAQLYIRSSDGAPHIYTTYMHAHWSFLRPYIYVKVLYM